MKDRLNSSKGAADRRNFHQGRRTGGGLHGNPRRGVVALYLSSQDQGEHSGSLTKGEPAILRFLGAAEIVESDLWSHRSSHPIARDRALALARRRIADLIAL